MSQINKEREFIEAAQAYADEHLKDEGHILYYEIAAHAYKHAWQAARKLSEGELRAKDEEIERLQAIRITAESVAEYETVKRLKRQVEILWDALILLRLNSTLNTHQYEIVNEALAQADAAGEE